MWVSSCAMVRRSVLFFFGAAVLAAPLTAQRRAPTARASTSDRESTAFFDRVNMSASLEYVLVEITHITDAQREQLEAIEARTREDIVVAATPLRAARGDNRRGWPTQADLQEGPLNRIAAIRNAGLDRARELLDVAQQRQFDRNRLALENLGDIDWLRTDDVLWFRYVSPFGQTSTLGPSTPDCVHR